MIRSLVLDKVDIDSSIPERKECYSNPSAVLPACSVGEVIKYIETTAIINDQVIEEDWFQRELQLRITFDSMGD